MEASVERGVTGCGIGAERGGSLMGWEESGTGFWKAGPG